MHTCRAGPMRRSPSNFGRWRHGHALTSKADSTLLVNHAPKSQIRLDLSRQTRPETQTASILVRGTKCDRSPIQKRKPCSRSAGCCPSTRIFSSMIPESRQKSFRGFCSATRGHGLNQGPRPDRVLAYLSSAGITPGGHSNLSQKTS